ncbi:MAG: PD40 domain-containing protein [Planctomycetes bacterium]|nr:PD40 domain-containing protein [Planctomycetota bacterium]
MHRSLTVLVALAAVAPAQDDGARLLRFPHAHAGKLVFVKGGDVWIASLADGIARRLTSFDDGFEVMPRLSPDGSLVAFSGEYSGSRQVWVVPSAGGAPKQLTWYPDVGRLPPRGGYDNLPYDWTADGRFVMVASNRTPYGDRIARYFLVPADGQGLERPLRIPEGGPATLSPDGTKLAYNPIGREWRTWKRYTGGRAQDVYVYDLVRDQVERITDFAGTDNWPMWLDDRIYFTSDRTGTLELWCYETVSKRTRQVTNDGGFDVLFPSRGDAGIAFERGGDLWLMERGSERVRKLVIRLADDMPWTRPIWKDGASAFGGFTPSPSGARAIVEFRGDLFSVPKKDGEAINLTNTPSRRERDPAWSPDGKSVAFVAEDGADYELFLRGLEHGQETRLTQDTGAWLMDVDWSPQGDRIATTDNAGRLAVIEVATRARTVLDTAGESTIRGVQWSADGSWLCYVKTSRNGYDAVWLCKSTDGTPVQVTTDDWNDGSPSFDPKGRWLWFTSARDYVHGEPPRLEQRVYALILKKDGKSPIEPREDREGPAPAKDDGGDAAAAAPKELVIDLDGIAERLVVLPLPQGGYGGLVGLDDGFLYGGGGNLAKWSLESRESSTVLDGVFGYALTPDRSKLLYRHGGNLCFGTSSPGQRAGANPLPTAGVRLRIDPRTEWTQMYGDAWRIMRDFFYDPRMHGVDWDAMRAKYQPLVAHVAHRSDLDFLIGELIGELNCGHTYVVSGELPDVDRVATGVLGCEFEAAGERYRIARILGDANWHEGTRNPLREVGVDVKQGEYVLAIDGVDLTTHDNPYRLLEGKAGRRVELLVNKEPRSFDARRVTVRAAGSEVGLRYVTWVERNRRIVDELSGGRIGYLHAPNTAIEGHRAVFEGWSAQARAKDAFILDDRYNGGGFVPVDMIFRVGQPVLNWWARRHRELGPSSGNAFDGPRAMLINGYSSSGGDAFPYYFRKLGLGKLIGQRTWGGLVGYSGTPGLVDGGGLAVPNFAFVNTDGEWDVEAYGVEPDLEVFDDPTQIQAGKEPMLEAAVRVLMEDLERNPPKGRPRVPTSPDRRGLVDPDDAPFRRKR